MRRINKKGFTMAELLIVIAIIAILIAIAFPVFGAQLNKARHAVDVANVRSLYSEAVADAMLDGAELNLTDKDLLTVYIDKDTALADGLISENCTLKFTKADHVIKVTSFGIKDTEIKVDAEVEVKFEKKPAATNP